MTAAASPGWFPHLLDPVNDRVLLVAKSEQEYRDAAFLDERSLRPNTPQQIVDWSALAAAVPPDARRDVQYIFHIGHVGSTLISRLLGELPQIFALREPLIADATVEKCQIVADAGMEELHILCNHANMAAQIFQNHGTKLLTIEVDSSGSGIVHAEEQAGKCRFATAGASQQPQRPPGRQVG